MNPFIRLIATGRISSLAQLKSAYRRLLIKSHPDAVGSDRLLDLHVSFSSSYQEARRVLEDSLPARYGSIGTAPTDHRLAYYQALQMLERIDKPYSFHRQKNLPRIMERKAQARFHFCQWNPAEQALYDEADRNYDLLKTEKPSGPYMKNALAVNVSPVFHNIIAYHLTGETFYRNQVKQNLPAVLQKLVEHDCMALKVFIELLIDDMRNGPAVFADDRAAGRGNGT